jgi:hypothetical protein
MAGGFKRSGLFGLIGVVVVAIVIAVIALSAGSGDANPKGTLALIFGVLAIFVVILFALQRSDLERVAGGDAKAVQRAAAEGGGKVENPTTMGEQQLWAALAVRPIDSEAIKARSQMWDAGRRSLRLGMTVTLLIFLTVPSIYLFESFLPLLVGGPLIVIAALYGSFRALAPGGEMDSAYVKVGLAMAPLGLEVTERPKVNIEVREATTGRVGPKIHGVLVLSGERHGRQVEVRLGDKSSEVSVREPCKEFATNSKPVKVESDPEGITVTRKGGKPADWLCDLWLAERLADAAA